MPYFNAFTFLNEKYLFLRGAEWYQQTRQAVFQCKKHYKFQVLQLARQLDGTILDKHRGLLKIKVRMLMERFQNKVIMKLLGLNQQEWFKKK